MYLNGILVVEGKDDESLIKSFLECYVFKTNGFDLKKEDILYLNRLSNLYKIIVLTDPDDAGNKIRDYINNNIKNTFNVFVDKNLCNKNGKHGVAESNKEHILNQLKDYLCEAPLEVGKITSNDLNRLGLNGDSNAKEKRRYICECFSLGICNQKTLKERLNLLKISYDEIKEELDKYGN